MNSKRKYDRKYYMFYRKEKLEWQKKYAKSHPEQTRLKRKRYKALRKNGGKLSLKTIQMVYEDNIKKYGTLTCYLCKKPIEFKQDSLDHKIPLSRGGTNEYSNLGITHLFCNKKKYNKTDKEFGAVEAAHFFIEVSNGVG